MIDTVGGFGRAKFSEFAEFDRNLWEDMLGGIEAVLELAGAQDIQLTVTAGGGDGDAAMEAEARWKAR